MNSGTTHFNKSGLTDQQSLRARKNQEVEFTRKNKRDTQENNFNPRAIPLITNPACQSPWETKKNIATPTFEVVCSRVNRCLTTSLSPDVGVPSGEHNVATLVINVSFFYHRPSPTSEYLANERIPRQRANKY